MKKVLMILVFVPGLLLAREKWSLGLVELSREGDATYSSLLLKSLETSLNSENDYNIHLYEDRRALFTKMDVFDGGQRKDLLKLAVRLEHEFLISGEYLISGDDIYIVLYAIDNAYQKVRFMKSYSGKTDADIFDLIDEIAADFAQGLKQSLPQAEPSVIVEYREKLKLVSSEKKFPRIMMQGISFEAQVNRSDTTGINTNHNYSSPLFMQGQAFMHVSFFANRWYFGLTGPLVLLNFPFNDVSYSSQGMMNTILDTRTSLWVGYAFFDNLYLSLDIGMRMFVANESDMNQGGEMPSLTLRPLFSWTPNRNWTLDMSPVTYIAGYGFALFPLYFNLHYFVNDSWGIKAYVMGTYFEDTFTLVEYNSHYSETQMGISLGLGVSYKLEIDM